MTLTPWDESKKRKSQRQEERTAKMPGARPQVNSGRTWSSLRDVKLSTFFGVVLIDNKTTENPENRSYRLTRDEWLELRRDAGRTPPGCMPALQIDIQDVHLLVFELGMWDAMVEHVTKLEIQIEELQRENRELRREGTNDDDEAE
jgi:hypothetical protein